MGLPVTLLSCLNEMFSGANMALALCPLLTQGQIEALERHASAELQALYLPRLAAGDWTGTMNLTEPQAGSDVGAVRARAEPLPDGSYRITGQKIFISWGDHDMAENVCHLVLARLPDGPAGTKGISLFLVPKFLPDADGRPGERERGAGAVARAQARPARQPDLRHGVRRRHAAGWSASRTRAWRRCSR